MKEPQTPETIQANLSEDQIFVQGGHDVEKERAAFREIARKYLENEAFKGGLEIGEEIAGVRIVLGLNASQLAQILGITRGTMSKLLKGKLRLKRPEAILLTERLIAELQKPGYWKRFFSDKKHKDNLRSSGA